MYMIGCWELSTLHVVVIDRDGVEPSVSSENRVIWGFDPFVETYVQRSTASFEIRVLRDAGGQVK
jgi:hypothetical protein